MEEKQGAVKCVRTTGVSKPYAKREERRSLEVKVAAEAAINTQAQDGDRSGEPHENLDSGGKERAYL